MNNIIEGLKDGLIVSCQVKKSDPQYMDGCIEALAKAAIWGGAVGLRIEGEENIRNVRKITDLPIIGLTKIFRDDTDVFMTPSMDEVAKCVDAGCDIIAIDGTERMIDGHKALDIIPLIKEKYPNLLIFADVRDDVDAEIVANLGVDFIAPTFYRFSKNAKSTDLPDWEMLNRMIEKVGGRAKVVMEGKIWTPDDAIKALYYGAYCVVVGSAITRPQIITQRFYDHMKGFKKKRSLYY